MPEHYRINKKTEGNLAVKELKQIGPFLQQVTAAFASVVDIELGVIDKNLEVIAGTGYFEKQVGFVYEEGCMTNKMIASPREECIFVSDTENSCLCLECGNFENCEVLAFIMCPITYLGNRIGSFSLLALNARQRQKLIDEYDKMLEFLHNLCNFIAITLNQRTMEEKVGRLAGQFKALVNSLHEGIIAIDAEGMILNVNQSAKNILGLERDVRSRHVKALFQDFDPKVLIDENSNKNCYYERKLRYVNGSGQTLLLLGNITLMHEGDRITGAVVSFRKKEDLTIIAKKIIGEEKNDTFEAIKGTSDELTGIKKRMKRVANTDSTIMIRGETGTGKSMFARAIHEQSHRRNKPFITINCAAIPATLIESELFGYEEGAFTGARKGGKPGKFELAHEGTLFLDEIGDMPLDSQTKLLQVLETKRIERVGGVNPRGIDVRIIAATNQELEKLIEEGSFRKDLYYRINVIPFTIPPLRERKEDISLLMNYFLDLYTVQLNKPVRRFGERTREILIGYPWPGNTRELANAVEYAVNIETGAEITPGSLPVKILNHRENEETHQSLSLAYLEKKAIARALHRYGETTQGKEMAAKMLGISRATLYRKLKQYGMNGSQNDKFVS